MRIVLTENGRTVTLMVYEIIGKLALYVIGTLFFGFIISVLDDDNITEDWWAIFLGAWLASVIVFLELIIPTP